MFLSTKQFQLNMIYGLLDHKIRRRAARVDGISTSLECLPEWWTATLKKRGRRHQTIHQR